MKKLKDVNPGYVPSGLPKGTVPYYPAEDVGIAPSPIPRNGFVIMRDGEPVAGGTLEAGEALILDPTEETGYAVVDIAPKEPLIKMARC